MFALTPAPVGQPRQIVLAHLWNILIGLACQKIPRRSFDDEFGLPVIWIQSLAVALGVSGQAKIGILHPPATSLSFAFSTFPGWGWRTIVPVMLVDVVVVMMSMAIINLSEKKQYPLWWFGLGWQQYGGTWGRMRRGMQDARKRFRVRLQSSGRLSTKSPCLQREQIQPRNSSILHGDQSEPTNKLRPKRKVSMTEKEEEDV